MRRWLVGAYGPDMDGTAPGVMVMRERADGGLELVEGEGAALPSPSFLAADAHTVYAALEGAGEVVALDRATLVERSRATSGGQWPCHLTVHEGSVIAANYGDGVLAMLSADPLRLTATLPGEGSGPHPAQDGPHAHASLALADGRVLSADLGADRVHVHELRDGVLTRTSSIAFAPGTGPRDLLQHPSGTVLVMGEHGNTVTVLDDRLEVVETVAIPGALPTDQGAGIALAADGRLYTALRGSDRLAVLRVGADGRGLEVLGSVACGGHWPRHLAVDGDHLHVANQLSGSVASFSLAGDGLPEAVGEPTAVPSPTFLLAL